MHLAPPGAPPLPACLGTVAFSAKPLVIWRFLLLLMGVTVPFGFIYPLRISFALTGLDRRFHGYSTPFPVCQPPPGSECRLSAVFRIASTETDA